MEKNLELIKLKINDNSFNISMVDDVRYIS
jgi:hypothetical protein